MRRSKKLKSTVRISGLTGVQLHFDAAPELPAKLRARFGPAFASCASCISRQCRRLKNCPNSRPGLQSRYTTPRLGGALTPEAFFSDPDIDALLVDSRSTSAVGGTGQSFDWVLARNTLFENELTRELRLVVAGGLNQENVAEAIATLHPWGVDVVSGVEASPGRKDHAKVVAFVEKARAAV